MNIHVQGNRRYVKASFLNGIKNKRIWMILLLVNVFAVPYALISIGFFNMGSFFNLLLCGVAMVINMLMAIVIAFTQFDYCYEKLKVDQAYSLPLTRKQKFLSDYFAGLTMYVGAYLVQVILSYIITAAFLIIKPSGYYATSYITSRLQMIGDIWIWARVTKVLVIVLLIQILLYTITSFVISCTGTMFEAISATVYFNILLVSTIYVVYLLCAEQLFGMDLSDAFMKAIYVTSPLGGFLYLIQYVNGNGHYAMWMIGYLAVIVVFFGLTYLIMARRKAEDVGKPFVIRTLYHVVLVAVMLHFGVIAFFTGNSILNFIILTFICYLVIEIVTNRGLKKIRKSLLRYGVIIVCVLAIIISINKTNCFGMAYHVADAEDVEEITISYAGLYGDIYCQDVTITDPENIQTILDVQKNLIQKDKSRASKTGVWELFGKIESPYYYNGVEFVEDPDYWEIWTGSLKMSVKESQGSYDRIYNIYHEDLQNLLSVELSDQFIEAKIATYKNSATYLMVSDIYDINHKAFVKNTYGKTSAVMDEFFDALEEDLKNTTEEEYLRPEETTQCYVITDEGIITILPSYKKTLALLERYNLIPTLSDEDYSKIIENKSTKIIDTMNSNNMGELILEGYYTTGPNYESLDNVYEIDSYSEDMRQLFEVAQIQYTTDEPCYLLNVYGRKYTIPVEYSNVVERILSNIDTTE